MRRYVDLAVQGEKVDLAVQGEKVDLAVQGEKVDLAVQGEKVDLAVQPPQNQANPFLIPSRTPGDYRFGNKVTDTHCPFGRFGKNLLCSTPL